MVKLLLLLILTFGMQAYAGEGIRDESTHAEIFQASENVRSCTIVPGLRIECPEGTYKFIGSDVLELNECEKELDRKFIIKAK